jgi:hypothetical protein
MYGIGRGSRLSPILWELINHIYLLLITNECCSHAKVNWPNEELCISQGTGEESQYYH